MLLLDKWFVYLLCVLEILKFDPVSLFPSATRELRAPPVTSTELGGMHTWDFFSTVLLVFFYFQFCHHSLNYVLTLFHFMYFYELPKILCGIRGGINI